MYCSHCGKPVDEDNNFCASCGKIIKKPEADLGRNTNSIISAHDTIVSTSDMPAPAPIVPAPAPAETVQTVNIETKCPRCNSIIKDDNGFCISCGYILNTETFESKNTIIPNNCFKDNAKIKKESSSRLNCEHTVNSATSQSENTIQNLPKNCPRCDIKIKEGSGFCFSCGYILNPAISQSKSPIQNLPKNCPRCRAEIPQGKDVCERCSYVLAPPKNYVSKKPPASSVGPPALGTVGTILGIFHWIFLIPVLHLFAIGFGITAIIWGIIDNSTQRPNAVAGIILGSISLVLGAAALLFAFLVIANL